MIETVTGSTALASLLAAPSAGRALTKRSCGRSGRAGGQADGVAVLAQCNFQDVFRRAEELSTRHTVAGGHRSFDVLHVATALHLGARDFLTFDANQRKLAAAEKLKVKL